MNVAAAILAFLALASWPLAGFVLSVRRLDIRKSVIVTTLFAMICWIVQSLLVLQAPQGIAFPLFDYLMVQADFPFRISFGLHIDSINSTWLVVAHLVALVTMLISDSRDQTDSNRSAVATLLHMFFTTLFLLSANVAQLFIFWVMLSLSAHYLCFATRSKMLDDNDAMLSRGFVIHRFADLFMAYAVLMLWSEFGTLELFDILTVQNISNVMKEQPSVVATIGFSLVIAAGSRVGIVPFHLGDDAIESGSQRTSLLLQAGTLFPAAIFLLVRFSPIFSASIKTCSIMCVICGLSVFLTSAIAVAQKRRRLAMANIAATCFGLMFIGISTGYFDGLKASVFLLLGFQLSFCLLNLSRLTTFRQRIKLFALAGTVLLATTLWGQGAVLSAVWRTAKLSESMGIIGARSIVDPTAENFGSESLDVGKMAEVLSRRELQAALNNTYWLGIAACFLLSLALIRCQFKWPSVDLPIDPGSNKRAQENRFYVATLLLVILASINFATIESLLDVLLGRAIPENLVKRIPRTMGNWIVRSHWEYLFDLIVLPIGLMGALIGWILFSRPSEWPSKAEQHLGPFARLSQHRFYFSEMYEYGCFWPNRVISLLGQLLDQAVFKRMLRWIPSWFIRQVEQAMAPLVSSSLLLYGLATAIGVTGILFVVLNGGN